jgi:tRNA A37 methylthiotransferase MiaB
MKDAFLRLKKSYSKISLVVHCIDGFPTETEEEFQETLDFIRDIDFNAGYIFSFSLRSGTKAETFEPKITKEEISRRIKFSNKFLKKLGYKTMYVPKAHTLVFKKSK